MSSLSAIMASGLPAEAADVQHRSYVTYTFPSSNHSERCNPVTTLESRAVLSSSGTTGLRTWEAALHLGSYLVRDGRELIRGKHVLELGAGTGLLSILCAKHLEARHVAATDGSELVVDELKENIFINGLEGDPRISSAVLKWGWPLENMQFADDSSFDIVLGADIVSVPVSLLTFVRRFRR
jgi:protein-lysine N-methyltransferase EEF2KMT